MEIFRDCQMCIIGASICDPNRKQMLNPKQIDDLFMLFEKKGFRLRIDYIDPQHRNNIHEVNYRKSYDDSIQEINVHETNFKNFIEDCPLETDFLIVMDFTGQYTPMEIEKTYDIRNNIKLRNKDEYVIPFYLKTLFLPMGCGCQEFDYCSFLAPLILQKEFFSLHISEFSLLETCNEMIDRVDEQKDICLEVLNEIDPYQKDSVVKLRPFIDMLVAEWDIYFGHYIIKDYYKRLASYYIDNPESIASFDIHKDYIKKTKLSLQTQILLVISILQGLFQYKEVKPWYSMSLPLLKKENNKLIPLYIYTTLEILCRKNILSTDNTIEEAIDLFGEKDRKAWLQKNSPYFDKLLE